ncbi:MAG: transposase, partial [Candidatus Thermoplasmatota archaeon]|nr:transposase [Candidatus Thermoplasmatota archaeon]
ISKARGSSAWKRMINDFKENPELAYEKYHMRSNVESANSAKKRKFSSYVRSINLTSQKIEESLSWVGYNLSLMPRAVYEFGLDPESTFRNEK